ncbi:MAG: response regulator [Lachnospiraceae bacterium]|nr:response regulator [Lachnospiraceae bacterium]
MRQENKENQMSLHVLLLVVYTVFGLLLGIIIVISGWNKLALIPLIAIVAFIWVVHIAGIGTDMQRMYTYLVVILLGIAYYGFHRGPITDIPVILCLLIILLARVENRKLISITGLSYIIYLIENVITGYIGPGTPIIVYSRIVLGIVCLLAATMISNHFIKLNEKARVEVDEIKADLHAAEKENERFLANMSHELRTPVNAIRGTSDIMLNSNLSKSNEKNAQNIKNSARRLTRQIDDVLLYSELENNKFSINITEFEPLSVINDAIADAFKMNRNSRLEFAIDVEQDIPNKLEGDPIAIKNIIVRLLDNAIKFTYVGGGYMHVYTRAESYGVNLNIDIHDTGCGITKAEQTKLFKGAYLIDSSSERKRGGLGLGLTIVQGLVSAMNGYALVESKANEGTHAHVTIPCRIIDETPAFDIVRADEYKVLYFFNYSKYVRPEIAQYYQSLVDHIAGYKGIETKMAHSLDEIRAEIAMGGYTHLFIASNIYKSDPEYIDKLAKQMPVCVFGEPNFKLRNGSRATVIRKPVFTLNVINYLINTIDGVVTEDDFELDDYSGKLALVVDDDDMNLMVAKGILSQLGLECETVNSGKGAIKLTEEKDYDIIFMDYMMPEMNGIKAMKSIREVRDGIYKDRPIVVLTANAVSSAREDFMSEGFDEFMTKPIESASLRRVMSKCLSAEVRG